MPDLGTRLRDYIDAAADPITVDEVTQLRLEPARPRSLRWLGVAAAVLVIIGVTAVVAAVSPDHGEKVASGTSTTSAPSGSSRPTRGTESPAPAVPAGWRIFDFEDVRFAVPRSWHTPVECRAQVEHGVLVIGSVYEDTACGVPPSNSSLVRVAQVSGSPRNLAPASVGTLHAQQYVEKCICPLHYLIGGDLDVTVTGPEAQRVLATFTDSGARRTLQTGPVADSTDWREVRFDGVGILVPAAWEVVDLVAGTRGAPGGCGGQLFPAGVRPAVSFGLSTVAFNCPIAPPEFLGPGDGAWIHPYGSNSVPNPREHLGGLLVQVTSGAAWDPAINVVTVAPGGLRMVVSIGVRHPSIARAILRSIHQV